jgi:iron complex transport system substrate-binding protein
MTPCRRKFFVYLFLATLFVWCTSGSAQTLPSPPRVVSLAPSVTETVFALGYGNRLVGVTTYCNYPAEARKLPKIGGFTNPSLEAILAKRPDLVIGVNAANDPVTVREIERVGIKVVLLTVTSVDDILNSIRSIAGLLGKPDAGERLANRITLQITRVKKSVNGAPRRATLLAVGIQPLVAVGGKNFIDELITLAGGENIAGHAAQPWLNLPDEYVVAKAPQVIIEAGMGSDRGRVARHWSELTSITGV